MFATSVAASSKPQAPNPRSRRPAQQPTSSSQAPQVGTIASIASQKQPQRSHSPSGGPGPSSRPMPAGASSGALFGRSTIGGGSVGVGSAGSHHQSHQHQANGGVSNRELSEEQREEINEAVRSYDPPELSYTFLIHCLFYGISNSE